MTNELSCNSFVASHFRRLIYFFHFSKFLRRSDAVLWLPSKVCAPVFSIPAGLERPCEGNAWLPVLPCGKFQCFSETPSLKLRHRLRRNWQQHLSPHRRVD